MEHRIPLYEGKPGEASAYVCGACFSSFHFLPDAAQKVPDTAFRSFDECRAVLEYDALGSALMAQVKYRSKKYLLSFFAWLMAEKLGQWMLEEGFDCLVPVPVHKSRRFRRGFNQAELLAMQLSERLQIPVRSDVLYRQKRTDAMKDLAPDRRILNLQKAFRAAKALPASARPLVIDDIFTTGATMEACSAALKKAGAERVSGACIYRTPSPKDLLPEEGAGQ